jgi:hypothetical protein
MKDSCHAARKRIHLGDVSERHAKPWRIPRA